VEVGDHDALLCADHCGCGVGQQDPGSDPAAQGRRPGDPEEV